MGRRAGRTRVLSSAGIRRSCPRRSGIPWYARHFEMVEVNSTFYAVPDQHLVERWCRATPDRFLFDVKLHRFLSHHAAPLKSLPPALQREARADPKGKVQRTAQLEESLLEQVIHSTAPLRDAGKFGVFLLQLSPAFSPRQHELSELDALVDSLSSLGLAVELRNRNWLQDEQLAQTLRYFRRCKSALVLVDAPPGEHFTLMPSDLDEVTNPRLAYLRLHGRDPAAYLRGKTVAERFHYDYNDEEIAELAGRARKLAQGAKSVHVVFNNNALDFAPHAAARMRAALGQLTRPPPRQQDLFR
ncbi:MAG: DUF72 domain-containing protein [Chthoniobacterales bacterium]|nr:DUF72 domain-containing protein [Chthoniobacterales bacterium]